MYIVQIFRYVLLPGIIEIVVVVVAVVVWNPLRPSNVNVVIEINACSFSVLFALSLFVAHICLCFFALTYLLLLSYKFNLRLCSNKLMPFSSQTVFATGVVCYRCCLQHSIPLIFTHCSRWTECLNVQITNKKMIQPISTVSTHGFMLCILVCDTTYVCCHMLLNSFVVSSRRRKHLFSSFSSIELAEQWT